MSDPTMPDEPTPTEPVEDVPTDPILDPPPDALGEAIATAAETGGLGEAPTSPTDDPGLRPGAAEPVGAAAIDPAGLSASEAAAAKRAETAAAVALVAAAASAKAQAAADVAVPAPVVEAAPTRPSRWRSLRGLVAMLIRGVLVLALFVGGVALGQAAFRNTTSSAPPVIIDPSTEGAQPPAIVREFIDALASGNADAVRSSIGAEPHARLISEFRRFDIQKVTKVETLSTHVDGTRSATEIVMQGTTSGGVPISLNLVVLSDGTAIEGFR
jgi:hypothetical protein